MRMILSTKNKKKTRKIISLFFSPSLSRSSCISHSFRPLSWHLHHLPLKFSFFRVTLTIKETTIFGMTLWYPAWYIIPHCLYVRVRVIEWVRVGLCVCVRALENENHGMRNPVEFEQNAICKMGDAVAIKRVLEFPFSLEPFYFVSFNKYMSWMCFCCCCCCWVNRHPKKMNINYENVED